MFWLSIVVQHTIHFASITISWSNSDPEDSLPRWLMHMDGKLILAQLGPHTELLAVGGMGGLSSLPYGFSIGLVGLPRDMEAVSKRNVPREEVEVISFLRPRARKQCTFHHILLVKTIWVHLGGGVDPISQWVVCQRISCHLYSTAWYVIRNVWRPLIEINRMCASSSTPRLGLSFLI